MLSQAQLQQIRIAGSKGAAARAAQTHCVHGHIFNKQNTYFSPSGKRECRVCRRKRFKQRGKRRKQEKMKTFKETFGNI